MIFLNLTQQRALKRRRREAGLLRIMVGACSLSFIWGGPNDDLARELRVRNRDEGLALVRIQSDWMYVLSLDGQIHSQRNPRDISTAWFSSDARAVAWAIFRLPGSEFPACPQPVVVEMLDRSVQWQLPGNIVNVGAMAVSGDGKRVAFDGTYKPEGTGFRVTSKNRSSWVRGLQYIDSQTNEMKTILALADDEDRPTSISFSPDGSQFVYDYRNRIFVYDTGSRSSRPVTEGTSPTWSPNGKWIAFRSTNEELVMVDAKTFEGKALIGRRTIRRAVHWSPDSRYVAFTEPSGFWHSRQMVVERIDDHATAAVYVFESDGIEDSGFYWVTNYRSFARIASDLPAIKPCDRF